ncbi:MAG TPA: hypothetical protein VIL20_05030 [Sandaracinaceae bacterium]
MHGTRTSKLLWLAAAFAAIAAVSAPDAAYAQRGRVDIRTPHTGSRPFQLDVHAGFTWWGVGFASGARFGIPILNNGFVPSINNAVYINFGADFYWTRWYRNCRGPNDCYWEYGFGLGFPVALHWEFYFNENWSAFVELGFQLFFHPRFWNGEPYDVYEAGYWFLGAVGGSFHVTEWFLLTLRVGTPYVSFGMTFQFG